MRLLLHTVLLLICCITFMTNLKLVKELIRCLL